jgi:hypothetical protein
MKRCRADESGSKQWQSMMRSEPRSTKIGGFRRDQAGGVPCAWAVRCDPFDHPDRLYELKLYGFRALAIIESGACRLVFRKANIYKSFPGVCSSLVQLPHEAVLDGEIVCLDRNGCPQFDSLLYRRGEPYFYASMCRTWTAVISERRR